MELPKAELVKCVLLFEGLDLEKLCVIEKLLTSRLALPDQAIMIRGRETAEMCFVALGAVVVHLPDGTEAELGSGEFFGELALLRCTMI